MWLIVTIIVILLVIALYFVGKYRHIINLNNNCNEALATMDIFLKRRYDLIPNLAETAKGYAGGEQELIDAALQAAKEGEEANTVTGRHNADTETREAIKAVLALGEKYPELHANANFLQLQGDFRALEQDIANARSNYNEAVVIYNKTCRNFPGNIISSMFKFPLNQFLESEAEEEESTETEF